MAVILAGASTTVAASAGASGPTATSASTSPPSAEARSAAGAVHVRLDGRTLLVSACRGGGCRGGAPRPIPMTLPGGRDVDTTRGAVRVLRVGDGAEVVHVRVPARSATGDASAIAWEALLAPGEGAPLFAGPTGLFEGEPGERTGAVVDVSAPPDAPASIVVGLLDEGRVLCGQTRTPLAPRVVDPTSLTLRGASVQRLLRERRDKATDVEAKPDAGPASSVRLLQAAGASSGAGAALLTDGDAITTWAEDRPGDGRGEFVVFRAPSTVPLRGFSLTTAPPRAGRVAPKVLYLATDGPVFRVTLPESSERVLRVTLPEPVRTSCVALVLEEGATREREVEVALAEIAAVDPFDGDLRRAARALAEGQGSDVAEEALRRGGAAAPAAVLGAYAELPAAARRRAVKAALGGASCEDGAELLERAAFDDDAALRTLAEATLSRCGPSFVKRLEARLDAPERAERLRAARLVGLSHTASAFAVLRTRAGRGDRDERSVLRAALARAARRASDHEIRTALAEAPPAARIELARALVVELPRVPDAAAFIVPLAADGAPFTQRFLLLPALARWASSGQKDAEVALLERLHRDESSFVRAEAARVADAVPAAREALVRAAEHDVDPRVRRQALVSLASHGRATAVATARARLRDDEWSFVRAAAAEALGGASGANGADVDESLAAALADPSYVVRGAAASALGARRAQSFAGAVQKRLEDEDEALDVRIAAAHAMGDLCSASSADALTTLSRRALAPDVTRAELALAAAATESLGRLHPADLAKRLAPLRAPGAPSAAKRAAERALSAEPACARFPSRAGRSMREGMSTVPRISPAEAHQKLSEGYTYVDVRTEQEFAEGHPQGAVNVPFMLSGGGGMTPNPDFVSVMKGLFAKDAKLVLGCRSGGRSLRAADALKGEGYTDLIDQRAGWDGARDAFGQVTEPGWSRVSLPVESGDGGDRSYAALKARAR